MDTDIERKHIGWPEVRDEARRVAGRWQRHVDSGDLDSVFGVPRGGVVPAVIVGVALGVDITDTPTGRTLVVDDLVDSGRTAATWSARGHVFDALFRKPHSPNIVPNAREYDGWLVFPWEADETPAGDAVVRLLEAIGEDPTRDGLADTPERYVRALTEMTRGARVDVAELLARTFDDPRYDEMVVVRGVEFTSMCEHHLLPFTGVAHVGYIPDAGRVVGLSKLARLVEAFAQRLQIQERMTAQIADALAEHVGAVGVGVVVEARHSCMACRGVRKSADMITSTMLGALRDKPEARAEFMSLVSSG